MANTNAPFGFRPVRHAGGGVLRPNTYRIADALAANIYEGDPVKLVDDGTITLAAAGERILGIFKGVRYTRASDGQPVWDNKWLSGTDLPGSSVEYAVATVYDDPNIIFEVQSAGTPAVTNIGNLADHVAGSGSNATGRSGATLSGTMATSTASFRILDIVDAPDNEIGQYARLLVRLYELELSTDEPTTPGV